MHTHVINCDNVTAGETILYTCIHTHTHTHNSIVQMKYDLKLNYVEYITAQTRYCTGKLGVVLDIT